MRFAPKSEEEIDTRTLLKAGEYNATVKQATDEKSQAGNDQIHLIIKVEDDHGQQNIVHDYLLEAMAGKLRHFCVAADLLNEYESGDLDAGHCGNQDIRVRLGIEKGNGQYAEKNVVKDYLPRSAAPKPQRQTTPPATAQAQKPASAEGAAKKAFLVVWNRFVSEFPAEASKRDAMWTKCFDGFFPGKNRTQLNDADWARLQNAVSRWDPIKGWPGASSPPLDADTFNEDDIPF